MLPSIQKDWDSPESYEKENLTWRTYLFLLGLAWAGKRRLDFCFGQVKPIHKAKLDHWLEAKEEWEYARYKRQKQRTSFSQAMADNGNLLIFEAESDTVVNLS